MVQGGKGFQAQNVTGPGGQLFLLFPSSLSNFTERPHSELPSIGSQVC